MKRNKQIFSEETIEGLKELGKVLRGIRIRLIKEGKLKKVDDRWVSPDSV